MLPRILSPIERMVSESSRRTQFSSCDACRHARVACDASRIGYQPGDSRWSGSCTRCRTRQCPCTFKWIEDSRKKALPVRRRNSKGDFAAGQFEHFIPWKPPVPALPEANGHGTGPESSAAVTGEGYDSLLPPRSTSPQFLQSCDSSPDTDPDPDSLEAHIRKWCGRIFDAGFGTLFGRWVGRYGCPMVQDSQCDVSIPPTRLFRDLDASMEVIWEGERLSPNSASPGDEQALRRRQRYNNEVDASLRQATHSFASHWLLSPAPDSITADEGHLGKFIRDKWRATREDMLRVINRVSYRSALTLYLFSQTPVPTGISEEEELNGINGVVCIQTALQQIQQLRLRLRSCQYYGSDVSAWSTGLTSSCALPITDFRPDFLDLESRAYWAAVTWDTAASVTLELNSTLTTGLRGACAEPAWVLARGFLVKSFHVETEEWRQASFEVTDDNASRIISAAGICRTYLWRTIASVKEALREGVDEDRVLFAWNAFRDGVEVFKSTIEPLLNRCEKQLHFLNQANRLNWYLMILHHNLGILLLVHALKAAGRSDLLNSIHETRLEAEHATINVLDFGLKSTYIVGDLEGYRSSHSAMRPSPSSSSSLTSSVQSQKGLSFIAIDPCPDHTLASIQVAYMAVHRRYKQDMITREVHASLLCIILRALDQLPRCSKSISAVRLNLQKLGEQFDSDAVDGNSSNWY